MATETVAPQFDPDSTATAFAAPDAARGARSVPGARAVVAVAAGAVAGAALLAGALAWAGPAQSQVTSPATATIVRGASTTAAGDATTWVLTTGPGKTCTVKADVSAKGAVKLVAVDPADAGCVAALAALG